jgi:hypothetical protein
MKISTTRMRGRTIAHSILLLAAIGAFFASPSLAQTLFPKDAGLSALIPFEHDRNVAVRELSRNLPSAATRKVSRYVGFLKWQATHMLSVFAVTNRGLSSRFWKSDTRDWSDWKHLGHPSGAPIERISGSGDSPGIDFTLPLLPGWGVGYSDWIAYQSFATPSTGIDPDYATAIMEVDAPNASLFYEESEPGFATAASPQLSSSFNHFNPQSGFESLAPTGTNQFVRHMFGTGVPRGYVKSSRFAGASIPLIELRRQLPRGIPQWIDHGAPGDHDGVAVGSGSAVSVIHDYLNVDDPMDHEAQKYVFVATDPIEDGYGDGLNGPEIAYLRGDGQSFAWHSLGSPSGFVYGAPLAIKYYTNVPIAGGLGRIVVLAVARDGSGDYELEMQYHDGNGWASSWTHVGAPAALGGDKFKLTSAVVWYDGQANQMVNLRINAFGYSEARGSSKGRLVEFFWNGGSWSFGTVRTAPDGEDFRTTHSAVVDEGSRDRIVVVGRTSGGRIYEFVRELDRGSVVYEGWNDLSFEPYVLERTPTFSLAASSLGG